MRSIMALIGLVIGALLGAWLGINVGAEVLLQNFEFVSPDQAGLGNQAMMGILMLGVGIVSSIIFYMFGRLIFKH